MEVGTILAVTVLQGVVQVVEVSDTEVVQQHLPQSWVGAAHGLLATLHRLHHKEGGTVSPAQLKLLLRLDTLHTVVPLLRVVHQWAGLVRAMGPRTINQALGIEPGAQKKK